MSQQVSTRMIEAAMNGAKEIATQNPVLGVTVGAALLLVAFGVSGIGGIIEKCIDASEKNKKD